MKIRWILLFVLISENADCQRKKGNSKNLSENEAIDNMMLGKGGTTIIETGMPDHLIIKEGTYYTCKSLSFENGTLRCKSKFRELRIDESEKYCFAQRYSIWKRATSSKYCIPSDGKERASFGFGENDSKNPEDSVVECVSPGSSPTLFIDDTEYVKLCKIKPNQERLFVFYANTKRNVPHAPRATSFKCEGLVCRFRARLKLDRVFEGGFGARSNSVEQEDETRRYD